MRNFYKKGNNKLNAQKTVVDGITFASKHEANRYCELKLLQRAGKITNLQWQVPYELIPNQYETIKEITKTGKVKEKKVLIERAVKYIADFQYEKDGKTIVEDAKGFKGGATYGVFVLKRKMMFWRYGIVVEEV